MKPIKLKMTAFGPFATTQEVDFSRFEDGSIFLVTGDTGAGKTTIFDAIVFALYGKASGNFRKPDDFKSHFSSDEDVCSVELVFELRDKRYKVYREPQRTILTRNNTIRVVNSTANLTLDNGDIITGTKEVDQTIEELLGLNIQQFKRTVMLAQGEFRAMIESDGKEKQEIFRRIFDTYLYERITQNLKNAYNDCENNRKNLAVKLSALLNNLTRYANEELLELISNEPYDVSEILEKIKESEEKLQSEISSLTAENETLSKEISKINIEDAKKQNDDILRLKSVSEEIDLRLKNAPEIERKRKDLILYKQALKMSVDEEYSRDYKDKYEKSKTELSIIENKIKLINETISNTNLEKLTKTHTDKTKQLQEVNGAISLFEEITLTTKDVLKSEEQLKNWITHKEMCEKVYELSTFIEKEKALEEQILKVKKFSEETETLKIVTTEFEKAKSDYLHALSTFLDNQAGVLASTLVDGSPCPVCGSTSHPKKATLKNENVTQAQLDILKENQETALVNLQKQNENVAQIKSEIETQDVGELEKELKLIQNEKQQILDLLPTDISLSDCKTAKEELEKAVLEIEKISEIINVYNKRLSQIKQKISEEYKNEEKTLELRETLNDEIDSLKKETEEIKTAQNNLELLLKEQQITKNQAIENQEKYLEIRQKVKDAIVKNGFETYDNYRSFVIEEEKIEALENKLTQYDLSSVTLQNTYELLNNSVGDKTAVDIDALKLKLEKLTQESAQLSKEIRAKQIAFDTFTITKKELEQILKDSEKGEREYQNIALLYKAAKGENAQRIDFERYVLSTYFDDILHSANNRFLQMTSGRYQMKRKREKDKGRSAQGLEIEILDASTGQSRNVSSLSGGESFKASLALALGLGDVVQSYSGGIVIDTMFIDEGFGTLDSNSLASAIECLTNLNRSTSRTIGIISHVSELKERITQKIEVKSTQNGSKLNVIA